MKAVVLGLALVVVTLPAHAQTADVRWDPWLGCWELSADTLREGAPAAGRASAPNGTQAQQRRNVAVPRVCVTAASDGGARFETTIGGEPAIDQTIVADATDRALADDECRGTQRAEWSQDGLRLFSRAELTCTGDPGPRRVSGLSLLARNGTWLDIQSRSAGTRRCASGGTTAPPASVRSRAPPWSRPDCRSMT